MRKLKNEMKSACSEHIGQSGNTCFYINGFPMISRLQPENNRTQISTRI